ncbi:DUF5106 domain-containing protein [Tannerella sp.]|uniref:DUF5106 domain-containing protein n=1 Tax=Tannerella sp. TaxID=2382127 RepID=UPI0026DAA2C8|nr:DUF5106 domain-containing protein [Tannerella sp.]MDO4704312.1 DUF5106 domain-containing protein [Tannerella sp.]
MKKRLLLFGYGLAGLMLFLGCGTSTDVPGQKTFKQVEVPAVYTEPRLRAEYLAMHYWDHFDFADTVFVGSAAYITEQALVDFFSIFPYAPYQTSCNGIKRLLDQAQKNCALYAFFTSKMEQYLFHPASPMRNEEFFVPVLEHMVGSDSLDAYRKARPRAMLAQVQKNRPGMLAADIRYTTEKGSQGTLYDLKTDFVLVFFHGLDLGNASEVSRVIDASQPVKEMIAQKKLTVLSIYPDRAEEQWKKYLSQMPQTWIHGYDKELDIQQQQTYVLRVLPTLYLLDKERKVVMKDVAFSYVELYLNSLLHAPAQQETQPST